MTRLYLEPSASAVAPHVNGAWDTGSGAYLLSPAKVLSTASNLTVAWAAGQRALLGRWVSPPLRGAQTISGAMKAYALGLCPAGANARAQIEAYVVSRDGSTVRGTLLALGDASTGSGFNTSLRNKSWVDGDACTTVNAWDGDRIVVGIGFTDASGTTPQASAQVGSAGTDVAENETATTGSGWVDFSQSLAFYGATTINDLGTGGVSNGAGQYTVTSSSFTPTPGSLQILAVWHYGGSSSAQRDATVSFSGAQGSGWIDAGASYAQTVGSGGERIRWYYRWTTYAVTGTLTATFSAAGMLCSIAVHEVLGADPSAIVQSAYGSASGAVNALTATFSAPTRANSLVLGAMSSTVTSTDPSSMSSGFGLRTSLSNHGVQFSRMAGVGAFPSLALGWSGTVTSPILVIVEVGMSAPTNAPVIGAPTPSSPGTISYTDSISAIDVTDADGDLSAVTITANGETVYTDGALVAPYTSSTATPIAGGTRFAVVRTGGWVASTLALYLTAQDAAGNSTSAYYTWAVTLPVNNAPAIALMSPASPGSIASTGTVTLDVTDADGDLSSVVITCDGETAYTGGAWTANYTAGSSTVGITNGTRFVIVRAGGWLNGTLSVYVVGTDAGARTGSANFTWSVNFPTVHYPDAALVSPAYPGSIAATGSVTIDVTDADGDLASVSITAGIESVYALGAFSANFTSSTRTAITNGYRFVLTRTGGWASSPLAVYLTAADAGGRLTYAYWSWAVTGAGHRPVVTIVSPLPPNDEAHKIPRSSHLRFRVTDVDGPPGTGGGLEHFVPIILFPDGTEALVHDGEEFRPRFRGSTRWPTSPPVDPGYEYDVVWHTGLWPQDPTLLPWAWDMTGLEAL